MDDVGDLDVEEVSWSPGGALAHRVPAPSLRLPEQAGLLRGCQQPRLGCVGEKRPAEQSVEQLRGHRQPIASQHAALTNPSMGSIADLEIEEDWSDMDMLPPWQGQVSSGEVVLPHNDPALAWSSAALSMVQAPGAGRHDSLLQSQRIAAGDSLPFQQPILAPRPATQPRAMIQGVVLGGSQQALQQQHSLHAYQGQHPSQQLGPMLSVPPPPQPRSTLQPLQPVSQEQVSAL